MTEKRATGQLVCMVCGATMNATTHAKEKHKRDTGHSPTRLYRLRDMQLGERKDET